MNNVKSSRGLLMRITCSSRAGHEYSILKNGEGMMNIPSILNNSDFLDAPLKYKWDENTSEFYTDDAYNDMIATAFLKLNHKATLSMIIALSEWVYWRMSRYINKPPIPLVLESHWAAIIDKHYIYHWQYSTEYISDSINGPTWAMLNCLQFPRQFYLNGDFFVNTSGCVLAMLARHISPDKNFFDNWFSNKFRELTEYFPSKYDLKEIKGNIRHYYYNVKHDSRDEPPIPREFFFEPDYNYKKSDNVKLLNDFLSRLNYKENTFLNPPEKMFEEGFVGIPYQYKG